jgi:hypothetical protein
MLMKNRQHVFSHIAHFVSALAAEFRSDETLIQPNMPSAWCENMAVCRMLPSVATTMALGPLVSLWENLLR